MKSVKRVWILGGLGAFTLGMGAVACATSLGSADLDGGASVGVDAAPSGCAALSACCMTLSVGNAAQCPAILGEDSDSACASFLSQITGHGLCLGTGSGSGGVVAIDSGTGLGSSTGTGSGTSAGSSTGSGSGVDVGMDAGTGSGSGSTTGSGTGSGSGTGTVDAGSVIPTTCAEANGNIGCCGPNGKEYYCSSSSTTVKALTCTSGKVCSWNASSKYYGCETGTVSKADPSGANPLACK